MEEGALGNTEVSFLTAFSWLPRWTSTTRLPASATPAAWSTSLRLVWMLLALASSMKKPTGLGIFLSLVKIAGLFNGDTRKHEDDCQVRT